MTHPFWPRSAVAVAVALVAAAPALAQNTSAALGGRVLDAGGRPVAGASVTILHVDSGSLVTATTDAEGRYAARGLRVGGPYTVTAVRGSDRESREGLFLNLAETASLDLTVGVPATQTITITGSGDRFRSDQMGAGTNLGSRALAAAPSIGRNLQDYARSDPRLAQTDKANGGISAAGQNSRFNSITIDGVATNDTFGLETNNLPTIKQPISIDAIQSVQVNISNYDVTQKGYTGANINAVTKSGTNEFKGSLYTVYRSDSFVGPRYNRTSDTYFAPPAFKEATTGFTLGGPILKDRLFFFASYEEFTSSRGSPTFGPLGSTLTNVGITQAAIDQAVAIARNTWGIDIGGSAIPQGLQVEVKDTLLKLDWNISDEHRASLRYTKTEQDEPQLNGFGTSSLSLSSWWFNQTKTVETLVGQWFGDWTPTFSTELKVSKRDYDSVPVLPGRLPAIGLRFSGVAPGAPTGFSTANRFLNFGSENSRHLNILRTKTDDVYAGGTWTVGDHELKFGVDYAKNEIYNAFIQNSLGNYTFGCEPNVAYSFGTPTDCNALTPAQRELATLENFQRGRPSAFTLAAPLPGRTLDDGVAIWTLENTGAFLQDSFPVGKNLNLMVGVRVDQQGVPTAPIRNPGVAAAKVAGSVTSTGTYTGTVVRESGGFGADNTVTLDGETLVQPRFGFNWKLPTERQAQLRGGFGLFQGAAANVWLSNPFTNTGMAITQFSCGTYALCNPVGGQPIFSPNPDGQPRPTTTPPGPQVDLISPQLRQPAVWKANVAFETELPPLPVVGSLVASAEWLHTQVDNAIYYRHLNLGAPTRTGIEGREFFWTPQAYNPACWTGGNLTSTGATCTGARNRALSNPGFGNVIIAERTEKGGGDAITLSLAKPVGPSGWGWSVAYTRTNATEVSPLTNSTSNSTWNNRNTLNPNEEVEQSSNYLIRDRVAGNLTFQKSLFASGLRTTFGVFYEGRRGRPYTWTFLNDANGDGISGNDLMYIPSGPGATNVVFRSAAEEQRFWQIVDGNPALSSAKGGVVGRNNSFAPWVNSFDVRLSQELPGFTKQHKASVTLDILNFGNLLNKRWGRIDEMVSPALRRGFVNFNGIDAQGRYVYNVTTPTDFTTRQDAGESQWAAQVTLRYEF